MSASWAIRGPTTPFLDFLAAESFAVPNAIVAGAPTYYSLPSVLASRYPLALGRDVLGIAPDEPTLASALKDAGYATAAFAAGNPYISSRFGYSRVLKHFGIISVTISRRSRKLANRCNPPWLGQSSERQIAAMAPVDGAVRNPL